MSTAEIEAPLEASLPIVDPHHHLWDAPPPKSTGLQGYLLEQFLSDIKVGGHNITHTVYVQAAGTMHRADGPRELRSVGETEYANGVAAMSASGIYGSCRVASGIVAHADLKLGDDVGRVLDAHVAAGNGRLRGIRFQFFYEEGLHVFGWPPDPARIDAMKDAKVHRGLEALAARGLSLDTWCFHPQLQELAELADRVPKLTIILNHAATPLTVGRFQGKDAEVFAAWRRGLKELAKRPNVFLKVGGLGLDLTAPLGTPESGGPSEKLAASWRPLIEGCIEGFGADRCMFESNFPPDRAVCSYGALWNAFKRVTEKYSAAEKAALYAGAARAAYRLPA